MPQYDLVPLGLRIAHFPSNLERKTEMKKKRAQRPKMTRTTGPSIPIKKPVNDKVHREGAQTYEAYADEYWDQAP